LPNRIYNSILSLLPGAFALCTILIASSIDAAPLQWHDENGYRWADLEVKSGGKTGFTLLSPSETGVFFTNSLVEWEGAANRVLFNGSGLALGDFDNDGLPDIFLCGLNTPNALYKNLGNFKFRDVTREAGLTFTNKYYRGAAFADIDGDGALDLLVTTTGQGVLCFHNDGHGKFKDVTADAGTGSRHGSVTIALADVDGNGTLDLYIANNRTDDIRDRGQVDIGMINGQLVIPPGLRERLLVMEGKVLEYGEPDQLLLNDGKGHFSSVSWTNGAFLDESGRPLVEPPRDWGLTAMFHDMNNDGFPDLYVCNDYWTPDRIWINDGKGHFRAIDKLAFRNTSASSMGVDFADIDRDGHYECFVVDMLSRDSALRKRQNLAQTPIASPIGAIDNRPQFMRNTLFRNRGDGTYAELANFAGLPASEWSWSPIFLDVDLDGYDDLLITTGHSKDVQDFDAAIEIKQHQPNLKNVTDPVERRRQFTEAKMFNGRLYPRLDTPIVAFHNLSGLRFEETTATWGTDQPGVHHGIAVADIDNDGDLDLVVNNLGASASIYRNESSAPRVAVRLKGLAPNTSGIGADVKLLGGAVPIQSQEMIAGGRYMAGCEPMLVFAAGHVSSGLSIEVRWRSGRKSLVSGVVPNREYEISEAIATSVRDSGAPPATPPPPKPLFLDVSNRLPLVHKENAFDDFERQPLLPKKLSQLGPALAWFDLDGDGWEDLIMGGSRDGTLMVMRNDGHGGFAIRHQAPFDLGLTRDQSGVIALHRPNGEPLIVAGSANYEDGFAAGPVARQYDIKGASVIDTLPAQASTSGPLAMADMDGDGNLDLFIGGRCIPGRYPEAASSLLFRGTATGWAGDRDTIKLLSSIGLVSGAVWSDLDGDGFPELILACEWGPIRVFKNDHGKLSDRTSQLGLDNFTGLWAGVTTGDFDGDGLLDVVASNWGLNSPYHASPQKPLILSFGDLAGRDGVDTVETEYDTHSGQLTPLRNLYALSLVLPTLPDRFPTHKGFSGASLDTVLGDGKSKAQQLKVTTLASMVFLNRKDHFDAVMLPRDAQLAPAFAVVVADFDCDGAEDLFLSQNFFDTQPEVPRLDAGRGQLLRGTGKGQFEAIPGNVSGLRIYGEQRAAAICDFNRDGRPDLAVTQNSAATKLYQNDGTNSGLRLHLNAGPGNPTGVGAVVRLKFGERFGPAREIHGGSGYWSQDSSVIIMSTPEAPSAIWIRWPGGTVTLSPLVSTERDLKVSADGTLLSAK
jgi:hypothetical protein